MIEGCLVEVELANYWIAWLVIDFVVLPLLFQAIAAIFLMEVK